jgi:hypothetical protein
MANYPTGSAKTYTTIAAAVSAVVSAVGATPATEIHYVDLYGGETFSENLSLPQYANCSCNREFPLVIRTFPGESTATISGNVAMAGTDPCHFRIEDCTLDTGFFRPNFQRHGCTFDNCTITWSDGGAWTGDADLIRFDDCTIDATGSRLGYVNTAATTQYIFDACEVRVANNGALLWNYNNTGLNFTMTNCRAIGSGACQLIEHQASPYTLSSLRLYHNNFYDVDQIVGSAARHGYIDIRNNIFSTTSTVFETTDRVDTSSNIFNGNRYYTVTKIIDSAGTDYADVTAMQAAGWETDGDSGDPSFTSTTWGNADFLRPSAATTLVPTAGILADAEGTLTTAGLVEQGALTSTARVPADAASSSSSSTASSGSSSSSTAAQNSSSSSSSSGSSSSSSSSTGSSSSQSNSSESSNDTLNEWSNLSNVVLADVTDSTTISDTEEEQYIREHGQQMTVQTRSVTNVNGERRPSWANSTTIYGWRQPVSSTIRVQYARRELVVTHSVYFADDPGCTEGDRITIGSSNHMVRGCKPNTKDAVGSDRLWRVDVEELL